MAWTQAQKTYAHSEKGRLTRKRYQLSEKGKDARKRHMLKKIQASTVKQEIDA